MKLLAIEVVQKSLSKLDKFKDKGKDLNQYLENNPETDMDLAKILKKEFDKQFRGETSAIIKVSACA